MSCAVVVDFGASRIKSAAVRLGGDGEVRLVQERSFPSLPNRSPLPGRFEVDPDGLRAVFAQSIESALSTVYPQDPIAGIVVSCEMHGFLLESGTGTPLTPYLSWKDERALERLSGGSSLELARAGFGAERFRRLTGLRLKPGLPFGNVMHLARCGALPAQGCRLLTLGDWLSGLSGCSTGRSHASLSGGTGFVEIAQPVACQPALDYVGQWGAAAPSPWEASSGRLLPAGSYESRGRGRVLILTPVGDLPAAIHGAASQAPGTAYVNIGTGSQVVLIEEARSAALETEAFELRHHVDGRYLRTITHIPAGRALNAYAEHLAAARPGTDFFALATRLQAEDIAEAHDLEIDLAVFPSAWNYRGAVTPSGLPHEFPTERFVANVLRALCQQYVEALRALDPERRTRQIQLCGGIPQRLPALGAVLSAATTLPVLPASPDSETLVGLARLAATL